MGQNIQKLVLVYKEKQNMLASFPRQMYNQQIPTLTGYVMSPSINRYLEELRYIHHQIDYHIVKAQFEFSGSLENGDKISLIVEQVFSDINEDLKILAPPM